MTNEKIKELCEEAFREAVEIRRILHKNPELGRREENTTRLIKDYLEKSGIEATQPLETGVVATVYGKNAEKTVALRADIDALPITEKTESEFASRNEGIMHACGHDMHTAALLGAAKVLKKIENELPVNVRLIFQPDEEGDGGAQRLIEKGAMDGVDEVYGIHVSPEYPSDTVAVKYGKSYAASDIFEITVIGKSGHCAQPHKNVDAIVIAAQIVTALQTIVSRNIDPTDSAVLTIGTIKGGIFRNTIAGTCEITGVLRSLGKETRKYLCDKVVQTAKGIAQAMGAEAEVRIIESYPGIVNNDEKTAYIENCAAELFGKDKVTVISAPGMVTEDFGYYLDEAPGCFYHIGCDSEYVLHSDRFNPDERAILTMMKMHVKSAVGQA
ncbi:MAG: amidohydrolase [Clostridia bacterium]|nr:amidohydrolase [Clostridia bacterium]